MDGKNRNIKMRHIITYKANEEWIYRVVEDHSGKSSWIKDILKDFMTGRLIYKNVLNDCSKSSEKENIDVDSIFG